MSRRQLIVSIGCLLVVTGLFTFWRWTIAPPVTAATDVGDADAVVMFVGGRGERLETALGLVRDGVSGVLVIPNGTVSEWPAANELCAGEFDFEVVCPRPDPDNTRGEARLIAELAATHDWDRVVYVTSDYHVARAGYLLDACTDVSIAGVEASSDLGPVGWVRRALREWVANAAVRTVDRGC